MNYHQMRDNDETQFREDLELLGYRGMAPATLFKLIQGPATRRAAVRHILMTVVIERTAPDSDPQSSLLPFSTDVHQYIIAYIKAQHNILRGVQRESLVLILSGAHMNNTLTIVPKEVAESVIRIPATTAGEKGWPLDNRGKTVELLHRLFWPYRDEDRMIINQTTNKFVFSNCAGTSLDDFVYGRYLMLASSHKLEFRWPEISGTRFAVTPDIYAISREDGVLFDEPKLLEEGEAFAIPSEDRSPLGKQEGGG